MCWHTLGVPAHEWGASIALLYVAHITERCVPVFFLINNDGPAAGRCAARLGTQAARAYMHEIECVERLALNFLMRELLC